MSLVTPSPLRMAHVNSARFTLIHTERTVSVSQDWEVSPRLRGQEFVGVHMGSA